MAMEMPFPSSQFKALSQISTSSSLHILGPDISVPCSTRSSAQEQDVGQKEPLSGEEDSAVLSRTLYRQSAPSLQGAVVLIIEDMT